MTSMMMVTTSDGYVIQCVGQLWILTHPDGTKTKHDTLHAAIAAAEDGAKASEKEGNR